MKLPFSMKPQKHPILWSGDYYKSAPPKKKTKRKAKPRSKAK